MEELTYGDQFVFVDQKTGDLPSECLSFKYGVDPHKALIFIKKDKETFMYADMSGQHTRKIEALQYCQKER